jgi:hypothetical protein
LIPDTRYDAPLHNNIAIFARTAEFFVRLVPSKEPEFISGSTALQFKYIFLLGYRRGRSADQEIRVIFTPENGFLHVSCWIYTCYCQIKVTHFG